VAIGIIQIFPVLQKFTTQVEKFISEAYQIIKNTERVVYTSMVGKSLLVSSRMEVSLAVVPILLISS
jgi:hypothetical protein